MSYVTDPRTSETAIIKADIDTVSAAAVFHADINTISGSVILRTAEIGYGYKEMSIAGLVTSGAAILKKLIVVNATGAAAAAHTLNIHDDTTSGATRMVIRGYQLAANSILDVGPIEMNNGIFYDPGASATGMVVHVIFRKKIPSGL